MESASGGTGVGRRSRTSGIAKGRPKIAEMSKKACSEPVFEPSELRR